MTSRWTVEVGMPVDSLMSLSESTGRESENASRIDVIFPRTSKGLLLDFAEASAADIGLTLDGGVTPVQSSVLRAVKLRGCRFRVSMEGCDAPPHFRGVGVHGQQKAGAPLPPRQRNAGSIKYTFPSALSCLFVVRPRAAQR